MTTFAFYTVATLSEVAYVEAESEDEARAKFDAGRWDSSCQLGVDNVEVVKVEEVN